VSSNVSITATFCIVSPISSSPLTRQCFRKTSTSNEITSPLAGSSTKASLLCRQQMRMRVNATYAQTARNCLGLQINAQLLLSTCICHQHFNLLLREFDREHAVLEAIVVENVCKAATTRQQNLNIIFQPNILYLVAIMHRMPKSRIAHGACSRDDPHPKLSPAIRMHALRYASLFSTKSGFSEPSLLYLKS